MGRIQRELLNSLFNIYEMGGTHGVRGVWNNR